MKNRLKLLNLKMRILIRTKPHPVTPREKQNSFQFQTINKRVLGEFLLHLGLGKWIPLLIVKLTIIRNFKSTLTDKMMVMIFKIMKVQVLTT